MCIRDRDMSAVSETASQALAVNEWTVEYDHGASALDGLVDVSVTGGAMDYDGTFLYEQSTWADMSVRCPE